MISWPKHRWILAAGMAVWILAILGYLAFMPASTSMVSGVVDGLEVMGQAASREGPALFVSAGGTATLQLGNQTARVTAREIEVGAGRRVPIPSACKQVRLVETESDVHILFGEGEQTLRFTTGAFASVELLFGLGIITTLVIWLRPALSRTRLELGCVFHKGNGRFIGLGSLLAVALVVAMWSTARIPEPAYAPRALVLTFLGYTNNASGTRLARFHVENVASHAVLRHRQVILDTLSPSTPSWMLKTLDRTGGTVDLGASRRLARGRSEEIVIPLPKGDWWWKITIQFENDSRLRTAMEWLDPRGLWPGFIMDPFLPPHVNHSVASRSYETKDAAQNPPGGGVTF